MQKRKKEKEKRTNIKARATLYFCLLVINNYICKKI
jgi:hypothetical protein